MEKRIEFDEGVVKKMLDRAGLETEAKKTPDGRGVIGFKLDYGSFAQLLADVHVVGRRHITNNTEGLGSYSLFQEYISSGLETVIVTLTDADGDPRHEIVFRKGKDNRYNQLEITEEDNEQESTD